MDGKERRLDVNQDTRPRLRTKLHTQELDWVISNVFVHSE